MGCVCISEILDVRSSLGLRVERDRYFVPNKPLSAYARDAQRAGAIVTV